MPGQAGSDGSSPCTSSDSKGQSLLTSNSYHLGCFSAVTAPGSGWLISLEAAHLREGCPGHIVNSGRNSSPGFKILGLTDDTS